MANFIVIADGKIYSYNANNYEIKMNLFPNFATTTTTTLVVQKPILSTQLQEFQDTLQELKIQALNLQCYQPFLSISEKIQELSNFFMAQTWDLYQEKEIQLVNEDFHIICKSKKTEFSITNHNGWQSDTSGNCQRKTIFQIFEQGTFIPFVPDVTTEWKLANNYDFMYKAFPMENLYLQKWTQLPDVLITLIVLYIPDWKLSESINIFKENHELNLDLVINDKTLANHISDTLFNCFKNEFTAFKTLPCGKSKQIILSHVLWKHTKINSNKPVAFSLINIHGIQNNMKEDNSHIIFSLELKFVFDNITTKILHREQITHDNVEITCPNWYDIGNKKYMMIGNGLHLIQIGWLLKKESYGWGT